MIRPAKANLLRHGFVHVDGSSTVTVQRTWSGAMRWKRSVNVSVSAFAFRYTLRSLKFFVVTTSVSPSQRPRASPMSCVMPLAMVARPSSGMMRVSWIIS